VASAGDEVCPLYFALSLGNYLMYLHDLFWSPKASEFTTLSLRHGQLSPPCSVLSVCLLVLFEGSGDRG
jgi:hypothetical protein